jgi:hypothetical protein
MALFGRDYDREYGYGAGNRPGRMYGAGWGGYDRSFRGRYGAMEYDADHGYKSRWQTDYGDPYGDRINRTPIRVIRGEFHGGYGADYRAAGYDRGFGGARDRPSGYGRVDYDPYRSRGAFEGPPGRWNRGAWGRGGSWREEGPGYRGYSENRYDTGWF